MLSLEQIEQLAAFDGRGARVLSVYLDLDPGRHLRQAYRIVFKDLVKEVHERLDEPTRAALSGEATRVQEWLESEEQGFGRSSGVPRPAGSLAVHRQDRPLRAGGAGAKHLEAFHAATVDFAPGLAKHLR